MKKPNPVTLTDTQKQLIIEAFNNLEGDIPGLKEATELAFPGKNFDGRSFEGKAVKEFLIEQGLKYSVSHIYQKKDEIELTEDQKEFIRNNCSTHKALEMAREIFKKPEITNLHQEFKAVVQFLESENLKDLDGLSKAVGDYQPPKLISHAIARVNRYQKDALPKEPELSVPQRRALENLIRNLHSEKFVRQMEIYYKENDRNLFESSFIRYTYDKPDLTAEEVDLYMVLASESVFEIGIKRQIQILENDLERVAGEEEGDVNLKMPIVEHIKNVREDYNKCANRQQKLLSDLVVKRSKRIENRIEQNKSILQLIEQWKVGDKRKKIIKLAETRKKKLRDEADRLETMDDLVIQVFGLDKDDLINS